MTNILVIAAHPDDEVLGCGATMAKHVSDGDDVYTCFMTNGVGSRGCREIDIVDRKESAVQAGAVLGVKQQFFFQFPDNQMDTVSLLDITKEIEGIIQKIRPVVIYTHFQHDLNIDHQLTQKATMVACRPHPSQSVKKILSFEVLSSTDWQSGAVPRFQPNVIIDVNPYFSCKMKALECYKEEMRDFPHSRSLEAVEALATYRGATHGLEKAEAFQLERYIA